MTQGVFARVAITGANGRLGSALVTAFGSAAVAWSRPEYNLDGADPAPLFERDRPSLVIHSAAWTDVDGCARDPELATRRNAHAVGAIASSCATHGVPMVHISTNEVFNGERTDGRGYAEDDEVGPRNPYGVSKLAGEQAATETLEGLAPLWIVRTAWLYGPPGADFPVKVLAAADRLAASEPLPMVADEVGSPTYTPDLAGAIMALVTGASGGGVFHAVNGGAASRLEIAEHVLARCRPGRALRPISRTQFARASDPPPWAVLDASRARVEAGVVMRPWAVALDEYLSVLC